jgi:uncharacterized membrane protein YozB (DUF420 family)
METTADRRVLWQTDRLFFTGMALASVLTLALGFAPTYFVRSSTLPPLSLLYHLHGALFTLWILVFVVQTVLVASRRTDIHRRLGAAGAVLAFAVFIMGVTVSVETLRRGGGTHIAEPRAFLAIPLGDMITFAVLVAAAVVLRRQADAHKRLMLLATISVLTAAVARGLAQINAGGPMGLFVGTDIFVLALILYDYLSRGQVHPASIWGGLLIVVFKPLLFAASGTSAWLAFADTLR